LIFNKPMIDEDLIQISVALKSLYDKGIIRTKSLVGELGEYYCKELLGVKLCNVTEKGYDGFDMKNRKIEIKTRRLPNNSSKVSFKSFDFDYCLYVELNEFFQVKSILKIRKKEILKCKEKDRNRLSVGTIKKKTKHIKLYSQED